MRIGLLVSSDFIHSYEAQFVSDIKDHNLVILQFVSVEEECQSNSLHTCIWQWWSKNYLYCSMHALSPRSIKSIIGDYKFSKIRFYKKGRFSFYADPDDIHGISDLDVIINCQYRIIKGDFLNVAKHGIWSFHHDDELVIRGGPSSFWEVYRGEHLNGAILQKLTNELDGGIVLRKGWFATDLTSLSRTKDRIFF